MIHKKVLSKRVKQLRLELTQKAKLENEHLRNKGNCILLSKVKYRRKSYYYIEGEPWANSETSRIPAMKYYG